MKLVQLVNAQEAVKHLLEVKMPIKASYELNKLSERITSESKFYEDKRMALVKELGAETEVKGNYQVTQENIPKFIEELNDMGDLDIDVTFNPIKLSELIEAGVIIEPKYTIHWLFVE